jgi:hypothetical protein
LNDETIATVFSRIQINTFVIPVPMREVVHEERRDRWAGDVFTGNQIPTPATPFFVLPNGLFHELMN